jgi:oligopeptide transport system ATP-binding protein
MLPIIRGSIPDLINRPKGCPFHPRCPHAEEICREEKPTAKEVESGRYVACHLVKEVIAI